MNPPDNVLLDRFAARRDEAAFRALVDRHLDHVHSVAKRITGSEDLARDVAQSTFLRLAERAAVIPRQLALPAWLHQTTRSFAINLVRAEGRRKRREAFAAQDITMSSPSETVWSQLAPVVDELVDRLPAPYRDIVLFRFYHNQSHAAVAARFGLSEEAARKRSARALDKLRQLLGKRGITTTTAALATLLPAHAATPAPPSLTLAVLQAARGAIPAAKGGIFSSSLMNSLGAASLPKVALLGGALALIAAAASSPAWLPSTDSSPAKIASVAPAAPSHSSKARTARNQTAGTLTSEERLARLREILADSDPVARKRLLLAYLDALPASLFPETAQEFAALHDDQRRAEFVLTMLSWSRLDLQGALEFADAKAPNVAPELMASWAVSDSQAALDWARAHPGSQGINMHLSGALEGISRTSLSRAISLATEVSSSTLERNEFLRWILSARMVRDRDAATKMLALVPDEDQRRVILGAAANCTSGDAPDQSVQLLLDNPEAADQASPLGIYNAWAPEDLSAAAASLESLPPGPFKKAALSVVSRETALRRPAGALELFDRYPGETDDEMLATAADVSLPLDPASALADVERMQDEDARNSAWSATLTRWQEQDAAAANAWIASHSLPDDVVRRLTSAVSR